MTFDEKFLVLPYSTWGGGGGGGERFCPPSDCLLYNFHMGGTDSALLQIVFFITSVRDAAEPRNLVNFPKI